MGVIKAELRDHNRRIDANHDSIGGLRADQAKNDVKIGAMTVELKETREDIADMKRDFGERFKGLETKIEVELSGIRRTAKWALGIILTSLGLMVAAAAIVVPLIAK